MQNGLIARVTDAIIDRLEKGTVPWHKPWKSRFSLPVNLASGRPYRGINAFALAMQPYRSRYWLTLRQAAQLGGSVRCGERGTTVIFWTWLEKDEDRIPFLRYYTVFNAEQCDGLKLPEPAPVPEIHPIDAAEKIVAEFRNGPRIERVGNQALYRPPADTILMPVRESFESSEEYYSTLFHELTHSTGHESRLARPTLVDLCPFGSTNYSKEELVAEMGAALLCGEAGIENRTIDNSAAYIGGWLKKLQDDRRLLIVAAAQAQKAADLILGRTHEEEQRAPAAA